MSKSLSYLVLALSIVCFGAGCAEQKGKKKDDKKAEKKAEKKTDDKAEKKE